MENRSYAGAKTILTRRGDSRRSSGDQEARDEGVMVIALDTARPTTQDATDALFG